MAMAKGAVIITLTAFMALFGSSIAATYNVGDTTGWRIGNVDYKKWAQGKEFHVGDTLVFKYNSARHDVKQVSEQDFNSCNGKDPIAVYTSGSDSITLKTAGPHYFLCGFAGHCQAGQKVDVNVLPGSISPGTSPATSPSSTESPATSPSSEASSSLAPASTGSSPAGSTTPSANSALSLYSSNYWLAAPGMLAVFLAGFAF